MGTVRENCKCALIRVKFSFCTSRIRGNERNEEKDGGTSWGRGEKKKKKKRREQKRKGNEGKRFASANCMRYAIVSCIFNESSRWK